ncbi:hypothetical protein PMAYCL1PPCAC_28408, partial [Pristionchus mayeri]
FRMSHPERAHQDRALQRHFPDWQVVTSPWVRHSLGYIKGLEFINKHKKEFTELDTMIQAHWESIKQPEWEYRHKVAFKNKLEAVLKAFLRRPLQLVITGSTVSGVGTANSDADICMCAPEIIWPKERDYDDEGKPSPLRPDQRRSRIGNVLKRCKRVLDEANLGINIKFVDAMIPLLKMHGATVDEVTGNTFEMEVDLSVSNEIFISSLHNTHLIRGYARVDARFAPLVNVVKRWSWMSGVRDPQKRRFNSYAMTLLVIHFLQCGLPRPILPNLQGMFPGYYAIHEDCFPDRVDLEEDFPAPIPVLAGELELGLNVAEIFYLFLSYYATLDLHNNVIRIKCGRISKREFNPPEEGDEEDDDVKKNPKTVMYNEVYIEDPIDTHNPGRTVDDWEIVRNSFLDALNVFHRVDDEQQPGFLFPDLEDLTGNSEEVR